MALGRLCLGRGYVTEAPNRARCAAQVLTAGQELAFDYQGELFILRPVSMMIASSQDKSASQGLLTDTTAITFEPAPGLYGELAVSPDPA